VVVPVRLTVAEPAREIAENTVEFVAHDQHAGTPDAGLDECVVFFRSFSQRMVTPKQRDEFVEESRKRLRDL